MRISDWSSDVCSSDLTHGWAVGHDGVVLATTDAGKSWMKQLDGRRVGPLVADYYARQRPSDLDDPAYAKLQAAAQRLVDEGPRSEERRVGKDVSVRVDLGGRRYLQNKIF